MHKFVPPLCLLLSLAMLIAGFALLAKERPQAGVELHRARVEGDEEYRDVLEQQLERRLLRRKLLISGLFGMATIMVIAAFVTMRPASAK